MSKTNTGDKNTGDWNSGDYNTGDYNSGNSNPGDYNSGNWNKGNRNSGNWNSGNSNMGYFNTNTPKTIRLFNKECSIEEWEKVNLPNFLNFDLTCWVKEKDMTGKEEEDNPTYQTTGGYLEELDYKEAFQEAYKNAPQEDRDLLLKIPNFDAEIFKEISGIDVNEEVKEMTLTELENYF